MLPPPWWWGLDVTQMGYTEVYTALLCLLLRDFEDVIARRQIAQRGSGDLAGNGVSFLE